MSNYKGQLQTFVAKNLNKNIKYEFSIIDGQFSAWVLLNNIDDTLFQRYAEEPVTLHRKKATAESEAARNALQLLQQSVSLPNKIDWKSQLQIIAAEKHPNERVAYEVQEVNSQFTAYALLRSLDGTEFYRYEESFTETYRNKKGAEVAAAKRAVEFETRPDRATSNYVSANQLLHWASGISSVTDSGMEIRNQSHSAPSSFVNLAPGNTGDIDNDLIARSSTHPSTGYDDRGMNRLEEEQRVEISRKADIIIPAQAKLDKSGSKECREISEGPPGTSDRSCNPDIRESHLSGMVNIIDISTSFNSPTTTDKSCMSAPRVYDDPFLELYNSTLKTSATPYSPRAASSNTQSRLSIGVCSPSSSARSTSDIPSEKSTYAVDLLDMDGRELDQMTSPLLSPSLMPNSLTSTGPIVGSKLTTHVTALDSVGELDKLLKKRHQNKACARYTDEKLANGDFKVTVQVSFQNDTSEFSLTGQAYPTKRRSKESAAAKALVELQRKMAKGKVHHVTCRACGTPLGPIEDFFFLLLSPTETMFATKLSCANESLYIQDESICAKRTTVFCVECCRLNKAKNGQGNSGTIGTIDRTSPWAVGHPDMVLLGNKKVSCKSVNGAPLSMGRWRDLHQEPEYSEVKKIKKYLGLYSQVVDNAVTGPPTLSLNSLMDWTNLTKTTPRAVQIEAFRTAMVTNTIVVLPTGTGKTLIAAMVIHKLVQESDKLALLLVDRLNLVDQHAQNIEDETGLIVKKLSSEESKLDLKSKFYEAVVATAGSLYDKLINGLDLSKFCVIVFDECHHALNNHNYKKILDRIEVQYSVNGPRLLGLSASPCKAKSPEEATKGLRDLRESFGADTRWYWPREVSQVKQEIEWVGVKPKEAQNARRLDLLRRMHDVLESVESGLAKSVAQCEDYATWGMDEIAKITGHAKKSFLDGTLRSIDHKLLLKLVYSFEINDTLGPYASSWNEDGVVSLACDRHKNVPEDQTSAQLLELEKRILQVEDKIRGIVFVSTKTCARTLRERLKATFPSLAVDTVLGQSLGTGMAQPAQRKVINAFKRGDCRLIVCTSVLEEGLDVQGCNLVFRYNTGGTLIQFVQSKGRARASNGKIVVILSEDEHAHAKQLESQQQYLDGARIVELQKSDAEFLKITDDSHAPEDGEVGGDVTIEDTVHNIISKFAEPEQEAEEVEEKGSSTRPTVTGASFKLFIATATPHVKSLTENIRSSFKRASIVGATSLYGLEVCSRESVSELDALAAFSPHTSTVLVSLPTNSSRFMKRLASCWDFNINGATSVSFELPRIPPDKVCDTEDHRVGQEIVLKGVQSVTSGYFKAHGQFSETSKLGGQPPYSSLKYDTLRITTGQSWSLTASRADSVISIESPISALNHCVFISASNVKKILTVYFIVKYTPTVLWKENEESRTKERVFCPAQKSNNSDSIAALHLSQLVGRPVLAIAFPLDQWDEVTSVFSDPLCVGLKAIVLRCVEVTYPSSNTYQVGESLLVKGTKNSPRINKKKKEVEEEEEEEEEKEEVEIIRVRRDKYEKSQEEELRRREWEVSKREEARSNFLKKREEARVYEQNREDAGIWDKKRKEDLEKKRKMEWEMEWERDKRREEEVEIKRRKQVAGRGM